MLGRMMFVPSSAASAIGAAAGLVVLLLGRVAGITGILANAWPARHRGWGVARGVRGRARRRRRASPHVVDPDAIAGPSASWPLALVAGLLVGFGARYGGGCTSGHGVCGVGRLSRRSIVGCATFVAVAMLVVFVVRHGGWLS